MKFPPDGIRYGDLRDWELTERDGRRWAWLRRAYSLLKGYRE